MAVRKSNDCFSVPRFHRLNTAADVPATIDFENQNRSRGICECALVNVVEVRVESVMRKFSGVACTAKKSVRIKNILLDGVAPRRSGRKMIGVGARVHDYTHIQ